MRSSSGRIIGGSLIAIAMAWILQLAGAFPFQRTGSLNQVEADRPPVSDPTVGRSTSSTPSSSQGTQSFATNANGQAVTTSPDGTTSPTDGNATTGYSGSDPNTGTASSTDTGTGTSPYATPEQPTTSAPAVRAGW
jgi:streptogramin lyase